MQTFNYYPVCVANCLSLSNQWSNFLEKRWSDGADLAAGMLDCAVLWSNSADPVPQRSILFEWVALFRITGGIFEFSWWKQHFFERLSWQSSGSCYVVSLEAIFPLLCDVWTSSWFVRVGGLKMTFDVSWFDASAALNRLTTCGEKEPQSFQ